MRNFILLFMSLLADLIVRSSHILARVDLIFLRKRPSPNLKSIQHHIWTSVKGSGKQLSSKTNSRAFLKISCSNFKLKLCQGPQSNKNYQTNQIKGSWASQKQKMFLETVIHKIFETNLCEIISFHVKQRIMGKVQFILFRRFLLILKKFSFREKG